MAIEQATLPEKLTVIQRLDLGIQALEREMDDLNEAFHKAEAKYESKVGALGYAAETLRRAKMEIELLTKGE